MKNIQLVCIQLIMLGNLFKNILKTGILVLSGCKYITVFNICKVFHEVFLDAISLPVLSI